MESRLRLLKLKDKIIDLNKVILVEHDDQALIFYFTVDDFITLEFDTEDHASYVFEECHEIMRED